MTLLRTFWDAAISTDPSAAARDEAAMRYSEPAELEDLWLATGLVDVSVRDAIVSADYADFDDLWRPLEEGIGPAGAYAVSLAPDRGKQLREEMRNRLGVSDDVPFRLTARAWVSVGRVPG